jgi:hypothetical protein
MGVFGRDGRWEWESLPGVVVGFALTGIPLLRGLRDATTNRKTAEKRSA